VHVFGELNALANREFPEGFAKGEPGNGLKGGIVPFGVASGGFMGLVADEVILKVRGMGGSLYVVGDPGGDLVWTMKQDSIGAGDTRRE
jgi:hypothetical protein